MATEDVRSRILTHATRLFAGQGYAATSIQQIAAAAGITRPTLVYHFGSKDQLRTSVLAAMLEHWRDELPRVLSAATRGGDRFDGVLQAVLAFFVDDPDRARLIVRELLDRPAEMTALFIEHLQPWMALLTDAVRAGQQAGSTRLEVDPEAYVLQVLHAAIGTVATGAAAAHILPGEPSIDRQLIELRRLARVSLFRQRVPNTPDAADPGPRS